MADADEQAKVFWGGRVESWHARKLAAFAEKHDLSPEARMELRDLIEEIAKDRYDEGMTAAGDDW